MFRIALPSASMLIFQQQPQSRGFSAVPIIVIVLVGGFLVYRFIRDVKRSGGLNRFGRAILGILLGGFVGGFVGFVLRPPVPLVGQLPFETVISRGSNLRGLDALLMSSAQTSFNYMVAGLTVGGVLGVIATFLISSNSSYPRHKRWDSTRTEQAVVSTIRVELGQPIDEVEAALGKPEKIITLGPKVVYVYRDMKIVFHEGRVADVQ